VIAPATTICNPGSGDLCDPDESCTGLADDACPVDVIASATTICRPGSGDVCDPDESCTGLADAACPGDFFEPDTTECRPDAGICDVAEECPGVPGETCPDDFKDPCAAVTDSSLCPFDVSPEKGSCVDLGGVPTGEFCDVVDGDPGCTTGTCVQSGQFRVVYTPSPRDGWPAYKLNASNPGQYFYNLVVDGSANTNKTVTIDVPYPFVTQGAMPVHVYDAVEVVFDPDGCFLPPEAEQSFDQEIAIEDYIGGVIPGGGSTLACDQVACGLDGVGTCSFEVAVPIPASGQAYVNVHLDYGLKGASLDANDGEIINAGETVCDGDADRYDAGALDPDFGGWDALKNTSTDDGPVAVSNCKTYAFSHDDGTNVFEDEVQSLNEFKRVAGGYGRVHYSDDESGTVGAELMLYRNSTGQIVQTGTTDEDGFYTLVYKHTGKKDVYTVILLDPPMQQLIELKGNGWAEIDFDLFTGTSSATWAGEGQGGGRKGKK
jgi:hypothetical protein